MRAAANPSRGPRSPASSEQPRDSAGRFAGGLAGGAGRDAIRETEIDQNELMNARIRHAAGKGPMPTRLATNGIQIPYDA